MLLIDEANFLLASHAAVRSEAGAEAFTNVLQAVGKAGPAVLAAIGGAARLKLQSHHLRAFTEADFATAMIEGGGE